LDDFLLAARTTLQDLTRKRAERDPRREDPVASASLGKRRRRDEPGDHYGQAIEPQTALPQTGRTARRLTSTKAMGKTIQI
jgi:hypothetical protein